MNLSSVSELHDCWTRLQLTSRQKMPKLRINC